MLNVVTPIDQLIAAMDLLVLPVMCANYATEGADGLLGVWKAYCLTWFLVTSTFALLVNLLGKPVMHLLYRGKFDDIAPLVGTLAFFPLLIGIGHTVNGALKAAEKPNLVFYGYAGSGAMTILVGIPLIGRFGLRGAVYGMLLSTSAYTIALLSGFYSVWSRESIGFRKSVIGINSKVHS